MKYPIAGAASILRDSNIGFFGYFLFPLWPPPHGKPLSLLLICTAFVSRGLCSLGEPLKTRVCFRYQAVDFPANNCVTVAAPNEISLIIHRRRLSPRSKLSAERFPLLYFSSKGVGALQFIAPYRYQTPRFSIRPASLIRLRNLYFQRPV